MHDKIDHYFRLLIMVAACSLPWFEFVPWYFAIPLGVVSYILIATVFLIIILCCSSLPEGEDSDDEIFTFCKDCDNPGICGEANKCLKPCVICGGEGTVDGRDHYDPTWDYEEYSNPFATCTSCGGSGLAKDMTWC